MALGKILSRSAAAARTLGSKAALVRLRRAGKSGAYDSLLGQCPVVVSLTTYGARVHDVHLAIESIGRGVVRPQRLVLWLDDASSFEDVKASLAPLVARGLEVRLTDNYGPHTKYFPMISEMDDSALALVTADDDILYPHSWLRGLIRAHTRDPETVHCYRSHRVGVRDQRLAPYASWARNLGRRALRPSPRTFATGVSGVIYPQEMVRALRSRGTEFMGVTPKADDVWLHYVAVEAGIRVRQIGVLPRHFPLVPGSQGERLMDENNVGEGNDRQIAATYSASAIMKIVRDDYGAPVEKQPTNSGREPDHARKS
jgi:hypothetical protein